ncbi:hypothetical protein J2Y02_005603 [Neobacillus drentensis]|nr:hypothetical protein [Neobacillus drentensis]
MDGYRSSLLEEGTSLEWIKKTIKEVSNVCL